MQTASDLGLSLSESPKSSSADKGANEGRHVSSQESGPERRRDEASHAPHDNVQSSRTTNGSSGSRGSTTDKNQVVSAPSGGSVDLRETPPAQPLMDPVTSEQLPGIAAFRAKSLLAFAFANMGNEPAVQSAIDHFQRAQEGVNRMLEGGERSNTRQLQDGMFDAIEELVKVMDALSNEVSHRLRVEDIEDSKKHEFNDHPTSWNQLKEAIEEQAANVLIPRVADASSVNALNDIWQGAFLGFESSRLGKLTVD